MTDLLTHFRRTLEHNSGGPIQELDQVNAAMLINAGAADGILVIKVTGAVVDDLSEATQFVPAPKSVPIQEEMRSDET